MGKSFKTYKHGLNILNIDTLDKRREKLCLKFAKNCLKNEKVQNLFPLNHAKHKMKKRKNPKKFQVKRPKTERYKKSSVPYMINLLNDEYEKKNSIIQKLEC